MNEMTLTEVAFISDNYPQFGIPIFRSTKSSNSQYIQRIDKKGHVAGFDPVIVRNSCVPIESEVVVGVGDDPLIALTSNAAHMEIGTSSELANFGRKIFLDLYQQKNKGNRHVFLSELALVFQQLFSRDEQADAFKSAYTSILRNSQIAAASWRDGIAIPAVIRSLGISGFSETPFYVVSSPPKCRIYTKRPVSAPTDVDLKAILWALGIKELSVRTWDEFQEGSIEFNRLVLGQGGVARYALNNEPFDTFSIAVDGVREPFAAGTLPDSPFEQAPERSIIGITKSDSKSVRSLKVALSSFAKGNENFHILNVRPIGFGAVSHRMLSPFEVRNRYSDIAGCWIVARHRLSQTASGFQGLRASSSASQVVKLASQCLSELHSEIYRENPAISQNFFAPGSLGVVSSVGKVDLQDLKGSIARLFRACASTEVDIEKGREFIVFCPKEIRGAGERIEFTVLDAKFEALMVPSPLKSSTSMVGFRTEVSGSDEMSFRRLCAMLMEDYGWKFRGDDGYRQFFENEGEVASIIPLHNRKQLLQAFDRYSHDEIGEAIVTNFSLRDSDCENFYGGAELLHFSEIGNWMQRNYGVNRYQYW